jgi:hypothetical protein
MARKDKRVEVRLVPGQPGVLDIALYPEDLAVVQVFAKRQGLSPEQFLVNMLMEGIEKDLAELPELRRQVEQKRGRRRG